MQPVVGFHVRSVHSIFDSVVMALSLLIIYPITSKTIPTRSGGFFVAHLMRGGGVVLNSCFVELF